VQSDPPRLILLDIWMPRMDGIETLQKIKELYPQQTVVMMSGHGSIESAVKAIKLGAYDYIEKPLSLEKVVILIRHAMTEQKLGEENSRLRNQMEKKWQMVGSSSAMKRLKEQIRLAAPTQSRVLVSGENGTGKELVARAIHAASPRASFPFVEINCAAIPETLIESELFGHEKGAFTGADALKKGSFELADRGTLFLDEIGDMSLATQAKVLRVIQEQRFQRVGGTKIISVDIRLISASNKDLPEEIKKGNFREDLYYRINVIPIKTPPLRDRREDIPELIDYFLDELIKEQGLKRKKISHEALEKLKGLEWKGNVRELRNFIERLLIMTDHPQITETDILGLASPGMNSPTAAKDGESYSSSLKDARTLFEKNYILDQLNAHEWNIIKTADALEIERTHLYRKMKLLGIEPRP
ncbi:MAG TPA: sigma-54 dependent transcriptional regulator, partial [Nitrospiria bacterium]|nr:sigma-54 dependent transcriptional regulator [Nitrospiria bacterium]